MEELFSATCKGNKSYKLANNCLQLPNLAKTMKLTRNKSDVWKNNFLLLANVTKVINWQIILRLPNVENPVKVRRNNGYVWTNNFLLLANLTKVINSQIIACGF